MISIADYKVMREDLMEWVHGNPLLDPTSRDLVLRKMGHIAYSRIPVKREVDDEV